MGEIIQLDETTRIRHSDEFNWVIEVWRKSVSKKGDESMVWAPAGGSGYGPYLRSPSHAATWLLDYEFGRSGFAGDLKEAVAEIQRIADDLEAKFAKAVGA